jgi:hypothetical protein
MDKSIIIWDAHTFQKIRTLLGHTHEVSWVGFFGDRYEEEERRVGGRE